MPSEKYTTYLSRTAQLHKAVARHRDSLEIQNHPRVILSFKSGCLSLELAAGTLRLAQDGNVSSAMALIRPQFESVVRGMWLLYSASDDWIAKLSQPLTVEAAKEGNKAPMLKQMLEDLSKQTDARLRFMVRQLQEFQELGKVVLNSFTHGGMVPLARIGDTYPEWMVMNAMQNSNGVVAISAQLLSVLTADERNMVPVRKLYDDFQDCFKFERDSFG
ncbi:MAG: DUF6988 family protein [bacterium]|jgi:hypothetical protein